MDVGAGLSFQKSGCISSLPLFPFVHNPDLLRLERPGGGFGPNGFRDAELLCWILAGAKRRRRGGYKPNGTYFRESLPQYWTMRGAKTKRRRLQATATFAAAQWTLLCLGRLDKMLNLSNCVRTHSTELQTRFWEKGCREHAPNNSPRHRFDEMTTA
jgi:hypothetical protein